MVSPSLRGGGLERLVRDLSVALSGRGFTVGVFTLQGRGVYADDLEAAGVRVVDCSAAAESPIRGVPLSLIRALDGFEPDVIHAHSGTWYPAAVARVVLRRAPLVFTEHGRYPPEPLTRALADRVCAEVTDCLCAVSEETARYLQGFLRLEQHPRVLPNGVDLSTYRPPDPRARMDARRQLGLEETDVAGIAVGRFVPVKNHSGILEAAAPLIGQNSDLHLVFVGEGPLEQAAKKMTEELGIGANVHFLGFRSDVARWLGACDLFVNASSTEGQPVSMLEAMAVGLPVVATAVGGVPEVMGDPPAGRLVEPASVEALRDALSTMFHSADRQVYAQRARARAESYSMEPFVARHVRLYEELVPRARSKSRSVPRDSRRPPVGGAERRGTAYSAT